MTITRRLLRSRVVVTLKTGEAFDGVLWDEDRHALQLRNAVAYGITTEGRTATPVDGEVILLRPDIAYIQRP